MKSKIQKRRLLLHRTGGVQGPFYQNIGRGTLIKTMGGAYAPNGPLGTDLSELPDGNYIVDGTGKYIIDGVPKFIVDGS